METYSMRLTEAMEVLERTQIVSLRGQTNGMPPGWFELLSFPITVIVSCLRRPTAPKILHLGDMAIWPFGFLTLIWRRAALVISAHGTDVAYHRRGGIAGSLYGAYLRIGAFLLGQRATIIANSSATREVTAETGWKNIEVVPLASDFDASGTPKVGSQTILFAGRLVKRKGLSWFVDTVLPLLPSEFSLEVAGPIWDESEEKALSDPRVQFLGALPQDKLANRFAEALCVIIPNIEPKNGEYEGFGLVAPEAAAAGGVVLAADHGGLTDAVLHNETGFLLQAGNAAAWANAIKDIANWPAEHRADWCEKATARSRTYYSWERVAKDTLSVYQKALRMNDYTI
ncbi:glycosyltransferase family 4 protein [Altererythrobacter xiamenensis]|nr:glycosyltransferase family 4 protein [Altererythrobacter xiamenensis]